MQERTCEGCSTVIVPGPRERNRKRWCSSACRARVKRAAGEYKQKYFRRCPVWFRECSECGRLHCGRSPKGKTCGRACENAKKARQGREKYAALITGGGRREFEKVRRTCGDCGTGIEVRKHGSTALCRPCGAKRAAAASSASSEVRAVANRAAREAERWERLLPVRVGPMWPYCVLPPKHPARRKQVKVAGKWWKALIAGKCEWCEGSFVRPVSTTVQTHIPRHCSKKCMRNAAKAARGHFQISPKVRWMIYERDKWICQLCGDPVDKTLPRSHDWAPSLDHIVCQSWTLIPDHSPSNLRLAHRWCNAVRSDETYYSPELLARPA